MTKAYIFPGQGSQIVGMGKDSFEKNAQPFELANETLGFNLTKMMFEGPDEALKKTSNSQPALLCDSYAKYLEAIETQGQPEFVAGHSLGEYSALVAAEIISFEDGLRLVRKRGELMEAALPEGFGAMLAVLGLDDDAIKQTIEEIGEGIYVANFNSPGQVVLSGKKEVIEQATGIFSKKGAKRAIVLNVSGPFHSPYMEAAAQKFAEELKTVTFHPPKIKYISNVTADFVADPEEIKTLLIKQIYSPVRWVEVVNKLCQNGAEEFIELGPGKVLTGLVKKIIK